MRMLRPLRGKRLSSLGFSLIEVLVALFVISVGIMGVMAALFWGVKHSDSGKVMTEASAIARSLTETIRLRGYVKKPFPTWALNAPATRADITEFPFDSPEDEVYLSVVKGQSGPTGGENTQSGLERFQRNISVTELTSAGGAPHLDSLARLSVKIYWWEEPRERNVVLETIVPVIQEN